MTQTVQIVMTGQLPTPPYQSVYWTVYGDPDPTGAQSQWGANYLLNIGVDSITVLGNAVNPLTLTVGGDLTGSLPNCQVSGLQNHPIATTAPTTGQFLSWTGSAWAPAILPAPTSSVAGDLSGNLPNPTVVKLQTKAVSNTAPTTGQALVWSGTAWTPSTTLASLTTTNIGSPSTMDIVATTHLNVSSDTADISAGTSISIDAPTLDVTSSGNISMQADNNMTLNPGGDFTINGGLGAILISNVSGSGITINDPSGGSIIIDENGGGSLEIKSDSGINFTAPAISIDPQASDFHIDLSANLTSGGTGYNFSLVGSAAQVGAGTGGNITLNPGLGASNHHGNIALISAPSSAAGVAGGSNCVWLGDRSTAPGTNPTGGLIVYSESGVLKVRSGANTVTLGNKPSVTGSRASGAALVSLLSVLAAAGLITDNSVA